MLRLSIALALCSCTTFCVYANDALAARSGQTSSVADGDPVKKLIRKLGSDDFTERREAETALMGLGAAAFDGLHDSQRDADLEIATQAEYLLHLVQIDWARPDDPEVVRHMMSHYGRQEDRERRKIIVDLARLNDKAGLAALSRIAHFELSNTIAKQAALAVLNDVTEHRKTAKEVVRVILNEIGESPRESARWMRLYVNQLDNIEVIDPAWLALIDEEISHINDGSNFAIANRLMEFHVQLCKEAGEPVPLFETLRRRIDLQSKELLDERTGIVQAVVWCFRNKQWAALTLLESAYTKQIKDDRLLLYLVAIARAVKGESDEAANLADRAFRHVDDDAIERNGVADVIAELGYHNWAEREWHFVIDSFPVTSAESMVARRSLANWCLHDRGDDKAAAEILAEVCSAVDADKDLKRKIRNDSERHYYEKVLRTQMEYFTACHLESLKNYDGQKQHLEAAYHLDHEDPDVLIAMFRLKTADDEYRKRVEGRIMRAVTGVKQRIESEPGVATWYNHYAWLVSNTQGDFDKAVEYSLKSLELSPDTPSYLDTLGRCYYAAGDLDKAIEAQRKAVELHPQVQVMQRQLEMFEKAKAEKTP